MCIQRYVFCFIIGGAVLFQGKSQTHLLFTVHRGLLWDHYGYDDQEHKEDVIPIIDSAYVLLDFDDNSNTVEKPNKHSTHHSTLGCLELCMFAEGSRHQEEIIVTGMKGRVEGTHRCSLYYSIGLNFSSI